MWLQKYNPELQKRSLQNRKEKQENFNDFVENLKRHSKSDLPSKFDGVDFGFSILFLFLLPSFFAVFIFLRTVFLCGFQSFLHDFHLVLGCRLSEKRVLMI